MAKRTLNDRTIKALKPAPAGQRRDLWDTVVPGLGIRSTDKGNHTYVLLTRFPGSKNPTRRTIGDVGALGRSGGIGQRARQHGHELFSAEASDQVGRPQIGAGGGGKQA